MNSQRLAIRLAGAAALSDGRPAPIVVASSDIPRASNVTRNAMERRNIFDPPFRPYSATTDAVLGQSSLPIGRVRPVYGRCIGRDRSFMAGKSDGRWVATAG